MQLAPSEQSVNISKHIRLKTYGGNSSLSVFLQTTTGFSTRQVFFNWMFMMRSHHWQTFFFCMFIGIFLFPRFLILFQQIVYENSQLFQNNPEMTFGATLAFQNI